jgi:heptosyltransferase-1
MRVLIVQTSPFGDIVDTLPAVTDARRALPNIVFDWVVEAAYQEVPSWHPAVNRVIPTTMRRWRKHFWQTLHSPEWRQFKTQLRREHYDLVIDCQGLIKSAAIGKLVKAPVIGVNKNCARESAATWFYQRQMQVDVQQSKIQRMRSLFAKALDYQISEQPLDYGLDRARFCSGLEESANIVFIHTASREEKLYPESEWRTLIQHLSPYDVRIRLPWASDAEKARAERLAADRHQVQVLPKLNLQGIACVLVQANAVVAVDTGLGHLSAALGVPTVSLYNFDNVNKPPVSKLNAQDSKAINLYPTSNPDANDTNKDFTATVAPDTIASHLYPFLPAQKNRREAG